MQIYKCVNNMEQITNDTIFEWKLITFIIQTFPFMVKWNCNGNFSIFFIQFLKNHNDSEYREFREKPIFHLLIEANSLKDLFFLKISAATTATYFQLPQFNIKWFHYHYCRFPRSLPWRLIDKMINRKFYGVSIKNCYSHIHITI